VPAWEEPIEVHGHHWTVLQVAGQGVDHLKAGVQAARPSNWVPGE
jgi:hypothetical protein